MVISRQPVLLIVTLLLAGLANGCCRGKCDFLGDYRPTALGAISDSIWQQQETNVEASNFAIHEHEFIGDTVQLNKAGQEHVKQIAARASETPFPVIVEPSTMNLPNADHHWRDDSAGLPVHGNNTLDGHRRDLIVRALSHLGVPEAEQRVVVAPALAPGFEQFEAERAYQSGFSRNNGGGFGGGFGGAGSFGGGFGGLGR